MNELTLAVRLAADGSEVSNELARLRGEFGQTDQQARRAGDGTRQFGASASAAAGHSRDLHRETRSLSSGFGELRGIMAALGIGIIARQAFDTVVQFERLRGSLQTVTGSQAAANAEFARLEKFASTTPYSLDQSVQAFVRLKTLGLDPSQEAMHAYGNTSAAMGKDLMQMIEAVADASTGEFERLKEFGIRASTDGDRVRLTFRGVTTEVGKNAKEIEQYLRRIGEVEFAGAMEQQMGRLPGLISNLGDAVASLWRRMGDAGATGAMGAALQAVTAGVSGLSDAIEDEPAVVSAAVAALTGLAAAKLLTSQRSLGVVAALRTEYAAYVQTNAGVVGYAGITQYATVATQGATVAQRAHAVSLVALGVAARGASVALALVGGPVGIAIMGAAALAVWAASSGDAAEETENLHDKTAQLLGDYKQIEAKQITEQIDAVTAAITKQKTELIALQEVTVWERVQAAAGSAGAVLTGGTYDDSARQQAMDTAVAEIAQSGKEIDQLQAKLKKLQTTETETGDVTAAANLKAATELDKYLGKLQAQVETLGMSEREMARYEAAATTTAAADKALADGNAQLAAQWRAALPEALRLIDGYYHQKTAVDELNAALEDAIKQQEENEEAYKKRKASNADLVASLEDEYRLQQLSDRERAIEIELRNLSAEATDTQRQRVKELAAANYDLAQANEDVEASAEPIAQIYEDVASGIRGAFRDTFRGMLDDGIDSFEQLGDRLLDVFKDMLAEMATLAIARPVMVPMVQSLGSALGVSDAAQGQVIQQLGGNAGAASAYSSTFLGGVQASMGMETQAAVLAGQEVGMSPAATAGYYALPVVGGGLYGNLMYGSTGGTVGGAVGGAAGMAFGGPVGAVVGAAVGAALGDAIGIGGKQHDAGGAIGMGGGVDADRPLLLGADGAFGRIGWAEGAHHIKGESKTPAFLAFFQGLADLDDALAQFMSHDEVARVRESLDGWISASNDAFDDFGTMTREHVVAVMTGLDADLGVMMGNFQGSDEQAAEYALTLAQAYQKQQQLVDGLGDLITVMSAADQQQAAYTVALDNANDQITEAWRELADTTDYADRVALEEQLGQLVQQRYDLERRQLEDQLAQARALAAAAESVGETLRGIRYANQMPVQTLADMRAEWDSLSAEAASETDPGHLVLLAQQMQELAGPLLQQAQEMFASGQGYQDVLATVTGALDGMQGDLLAAATPEEEIIAALDALQAETVNLLTEIRDLLANADADVAAAVEVEAAAATAAADAAKAAALEKWRALVAAAKANEELPQLASGLPWVPYDGFTAQLHEGEAVIDAPMMSALRRYGLPSASASAGHATDTPRLLEALARIEEALRASGTMVIRVVTPDGRVQREETIAEVRRRIEHGELLVKV